MPESNTHKRKKLYFVLTVSSIIAMLVTFQYNNILAYRDETLCVINGDGNGCDYNPIANLTEQSISEENVTVRGYCSLTASKLGDHQKVLSYCLFGNFSRYASGLSSILASAKSLYPGWTVRLYTQPQLYAKELTPLLREHANLLVCDVANLPGPRQDIRHVEPRLWRLAALADEQVDVVLFRDTDAMIIPREVAAVEEFVVSKRSLHIMRDHPGHNFQILAGMFGVHQTEVNREIFTSIRENLFENGIIRFNKNHRKDFDQRILKDYLYEQMVSSSFVHDSYYCTRYFPRGLPFPTKRDAKWFVGNRRYRPEHANEMVPRPCPVSCRPKNHSEWLYC